MTRTKRKNKLELTYFVFLLKKPEHGYKIIYFAKKYFYFTR